MKRYVFTFRAMGSPCEVQCWAAHEREAQHWLTIAKNEIERIEQKYSRYRVDSVLSAINRAAGADEISVDSETASLLDYAQTCFEASDGAFDITCGALHRVWSFGAKSAQTAPQVPTQAELNAVLQFIGWQRVRWHSPTLTLPAHMEIDLGGVAKEYAADRAAICCAQAGAQALLVNLGGDIRAIAPQPGNEPWRVGITHPREIGDTIATMEIMHGGVATSGDYERFFVVDGRRYCHILDARTGQPCTGAQAVTVAAPACMVAGSLCTLAMLAGGAALSLLRESGFSYLLVDENGRVSRA
jgi:FAD:protein FMN transferase